MGQGGDSSRYGVRRGGGGGHQAGSARLRVARPVPRPPVIRRNGRRYSPGPLGWLARLVAAGLAMPLDLVLLGSAFGALYLATVLPDLPSLDGLRNVQYREPLRVYSADGALMAEFGVQRRQSVPFAAIPPLLVKAFLAAEDSRFFTHEGIDPKGLARAALEVARSGHPTQGGSTITMQLTRNLFLTPEKTLHRKVTELLLAQRVERELGKDEILELYLNKIFFGHRAYGISAAAELYYGKRLDDLTIAEMAMLAGIPKAPSTTNPITAPTAARARRDYILGRMLVLDYIDADQYHQAVTQPDIASLHRPPIDLSAGYAAEMVRREMIERYGEAVYGEGLRVYTTLDGRLQLAAQSALREGLLDYDRRHGYRGPEGRFDPAADPAAMDAFLASVPALPELNAGLVVSVEAKTAEVYLGQGRSVTIALEGIRWARPYRDENSRGRTPRRADDVLTAGDLIRVRRDGDDTWVLAQAPAVSGALLGLAPEDGAILALVGGYAFEVSAFNRAVDAQRQPGSSFKPFIYATALSRGWTPASLLRDEPIRVRLGRGRTWTPQNADGRTMGPIRLRVALAKSRNLATIDLLRSLGVAAAREHIARFGFASETLPKGLALALGTGEASPQQMAAGYAVFANGGYRVDPYLIERIESPEGNVLFEASQPRACSDCWARYGSTPAATRPLRSGRVAPSAERVLDPRVAYQMTSLLRDVIEDGTGRRALALGRSDVVGKTGTTNAVRDSWFCGYQKDVVAVAWMGFDGFTPLGRGEGGGRAALGVWMDFMGEALKDKPEATLDPPPGLVAVRIDKRTGAETDADGPNTIEELIPSEYHWMPLGSAPVSEPEPRTSVPALLDRLF
ncbi:penicillin-binding protein, 1A family [Thioflavicoccus mobilis 8321]|uniref:Penicillin-binding protein 1A n=1 Tax=Thioflavicoccus mobilis 8321 TaxID=765912 RepID=L0GUD3_9GAMM|nr:PBP1A family penicillin-binding protein [Thioflavicoccus mobilis]AGA90383.1 penicillin-binding protein, 1A family [Thioflavicoccus mobilis 8321]